MPYLWPHELLTPAQREREDDDRGYPSCPEEMVRRDVVHIQPERQGSAPGRMQAGHVLVRIRCAMARSKCLQRPFC